MARQNLAFHEARDLIQRKTYVSKTRSIFTSFHKDKDFPSLKTYTNSSNAATFFDSNTKKNRFDILSDIEADEPNAYENLTFINKPKRFIKSMNKNTKAKTKN